MDFSRWIFVFLILFAGSVCDAAYKPILNPITGQLDYVTSLYTCGNGLGIVLEDSSTCTWCETISTAGTLTMTLIQCPAQGRSCTTGVPLGLLLSITCGPYGP